METIPKSYNQIKEAFDAGKEITYGRTKVDKVEKKKIRTVTGDLMFKPWLPAVRIKN